MQEQALCPKKSPEDECSDHYVERIESLYAHARETRTTRRLMDVLA